jgi:hypothetical protein
MCKRTEFSLGPQSYGSDTLIIATATSVHLATNFTGYFGNATLNRCVNVFV